MQLRRFRGQAKRGARETAYYQRLFADLDLDPGRLRADDIARIPLTPKAALRADPTAFVRRGAKPVPAHDDDRHHRLAHERVLLGL
jgi:phenylacetate-coenzyme A ligase PaaK-like adenylate-forming protein